MALWHATVTIGDRARFPIGRLGDTEVYNRTFAAIAFTLDGGIIAARRHDGLTRTVSLQWWERYALDEPLRRPRAPLGPLPRPQLQADRTAAGYFVSARHRDGRYKLLLGPFACPGDARRWERPARHYFNQHHGNGAQWWDVAIGVSKAHSQGGIWNGQIIGRV